MSITPGQFPGQEQRSDSWRLLLAVAIIAGLWALWPYIFPRPEVVPGEDTGAAVDAAAAATAAATPEDGGAVPSTMAAASQPGSAPSSQPAAPAAPKPEEAFVSIASDLSSAQLSTWGAAFTEFLLTKYKDVVKKEEGAKAPPVDLVPGKGTQDRSFSVRTITGTFPLAADAAYEIVEQGAHHVVMRHDTERGVVVTRTFDFHDTSYSFDVETSLENQTDAVQSATLEMAITGKEREDEAESSGWFRPSGDQMSWACRTDELHQQLSTKHEKDQTIQGAVKWAGINRQYFLAAMIPRQGQTTACSAKRLAGKGIQVAIEYAPVTIPARQSVSFVSTGFFGPKKVTALEGLGASVEESVNFGWFGVISRPLLWLLVFFYGYVKNYGIAIVLLTLLVKLVLLPVTQKSFESGERMKRIQPLMKEIQAKYKGDRMMASQKQMELFKEHKVSPFGGCLPMALQMPIWIALYRTLWTSVELYQQPFIEGWIDNLAFKDTTYVLPIAVGVVMLVQQFFTPVPQDNPSMKYVMWGMPIMFLFIMINLPSGLALYIFSNSLLTIAQQYYIRRKFAANNPLPAPAAASTEKKEPQPRKKKKKKKA